MLSYINTRNVLSFSAQKERLLCSVNGTRTHEMYSPFRYVSENISQTDWNLLAPITKTHTGSLCTDRWSTSIEECVHLIHPQGVHFVCSLSKSAPIIHCPNSHSLVSKKSLSWGSNRTRTHEMYSLRTTQHSGVYRTTRRNLPLVLNHSFLPL